MSGAGSARAAQTLIACAVAALAFAAPASAKTAGIEEPYGSMTLPDGSTCTVTLTTYVGDPEQVQLTGMIALPGRHVKAAVTSELSLWRKVMYPKGNMTVMRRICGPMQDQMREKGLIPK